MSTDAEQAIELCNKLLYCSADKYNRGKPFTITLATARSDTPCTVAQAAESPQEVTLAYATNDDNDKEVADITDNAALKPPAALNQTFSVTSPINSIRVSIEEDPFDSQLTKIIIPVENGKAYEEMIRWRTLIDNHITNEFHIEMTETEYSGLKNLADIQFSTIDSDHLILSNIVAGSGVDIWISLLMLQHNYTNYSSLIKLTDHSIPVHDPDYIKWIDLRFSNEETVYFRMILHDGEFSTEYNMYNNTFRMVLDAWQDEVLNQVNTSNCVTPIPANCFASPLTLVGASFPLNSQDHTVQESYTMQEEEEAYIKNLNRFVLGS